MSSFFTQNVCRKDESVYMALEVISRLTCRNGPQPQSHHSEMRRAKAASFGGGWSCTFYSSEIGEMCLNIICTRNKKVYLTNKMLKKRSSLSANSSLQVPLCQVAVRYVTLIERLITTFPSPQHSYTHNCVSN